MTRILQPHEHLVQCGVTAMRAPDGTMLPAVPTYVIVPDRLIDPETEISYAELKLYGDVAAVLKDMHEKFAAYPKGLKQQKKGQPA